LLHTRQWRLRYASAFIVVALISLIRLALVPFIGIQSLLLPYTLGVIIAGCVGGLGPALLATVLTPIPATLLFTDWPNNRHPIGWVAHVAFFLVVGAVISFIVGRLQLAYRTQAQLLSDARAAESQARASEARLRLITDAMPALIAYIDSSHRYQFGNRQYQEWFGRAAEHLEGRHLREVLGDGVYEAALPHIERALAGERAAFESEIPYRTGGSRYIEAHYVPDHDATGAVKGIFALVLDKTTRKHIEDRLRESQQRLSLALRAGRAGSFEWDISTDRILWSDELLELYGVTREAFGGTYQSWLDLVHPEDRERLNEQAQQILERGENAAEFRILRHDTQECRWVHARAQLVNDATGAPVRISGINCDITELRQAEQALRVAEQRKDEFLAMLAHELRNPLASITNAAELLAQHQIPDISLRSLGGLFQRQAGQLSRLVDDLLDVARITRGVIELRKAPLILDSVLETALETVRPRLERRRQTLSVSPWPSGVRVEGDAARLTQVFANLLSNASKFSEDGALIELSVEVRDGSAVVRVRDSGIGIEAQMVPQIFDLFVQADRSLHRPRGGLGVGLTIVKTLVERHGGTIEAHSEGLGRGSTFTVRLPLLAADEAASTFQSSAESQSAQQDAARHILIVDDNHDAADSLATLFDVVGHDIRVVYDGKSALSTLETFAAEFILLDIGMPEMDGYEVAQAVRARFPHGPPHLFAVTGYGGDQDRARARETGFDAHFTKPVDTTQILALIDATPRAEVHRQTGT